VLHDSFESTKIFASQILTKLKKEECKKVQRAARQIGWAACLMLLA